jgi:transposase
MKAHDDYETELSKTLGFFGRPRTAAQVASKFGLSRFAAYERIRALKAKRALKSMGTQQGPKGKTGPKAEAWVAKAA